jgi:hypothetical protein
MIRRHPRGWPVDLPVALVERAREKGAVLPAGAYEAQLLASSGKHSNALPRLVDCVCPDDGAAKSKADEETAAEAPPAEPPPIKSQHHEPIKHSAFVETVGQPYQLKVAG